MCGIAGYIYGTRAPRDAIEAATRRMAQHMRARGPDAEGHWHRDGIALVHRRLAIVDLDARANQPMATPDGRFTLVFNGEIYNHVELRRELAAAGTQFRTQSDTEVLLQLLAQEGTRALPRLRGMFAFALWDAQTRELLLVRDPYGIKPLYYAHVEDGFAFASQVKTLLAARTTSAELEPAGLVGFYLWGNVPEPWTLHRDVLAVPAGHSVRLRLGAPPDLRCWHDIRTHWRAAAMPADLDTVRATVATALHDTVRAHLVADVPASVFLSGGVDSAMLAGVLADLGARIECITIGFSEFTELAHDEVPRAQRIAAHYGLPHTIRRVTAQEFEADVPRILDAMDQPSIDGVNTWFASKAASERGYKIALSGVGGDELFYGYPSFAQLPRAARILRHGLARTAVSALGPLLKQLASMQGKHKLAGLPDYSNSLEGLFFLRRGLFLPNELPRLMDVDAAREGLAKLGGVAAGVPTVSARNDQAAVAALESSWYLRNQLLRDADWASMAHSLELRTPLVDVRLLSALAPLSDAFANGMGKRLQSHAPATALPSDIVAMPKTGFSVPMAAWLNACVDTTRAESGAPWGRSWARTVAARLAPCG